MKLRTSICARFSGQIILLVIIMLCCFIDFNLCSGIYFCGAIFLLGERMSISVKSVSRHQNRLTGMFFLVLPANILYKMFSCIFIWYISAKHSAQKNTFVPKTHSEIVIPEDDEISVFRFIARVTGVVCAYEWNSTTFAQTFASEIGIAICVLIL